MTEDSKTAAVVQALTKELEQVTKQITMMISAGDMFSSDKLIAIDRLSESRDRLVAAIASIATARPS